jgi:hypothetical protein
VRKSRPPWTRHEVIAALRARHAAGRSLRFAKLRDEEPGLVKAAQMRFPFSLARALKAAGLDPALARRR